MPGFLLVEFLIPRKAIYREFGAPIVNLRIADYTSGLLYGTPLLTGNPRRDSPIPVRAFS